MIQPFSIGHEIELTFTVGENDLAQFETGLVHPVYSTFALGRDAEWTCRQFALQMKEAHEEGIGTRLTLEHLRPAVLGAEVTIRARIVNVSGNEIICHWDAFTKEYKMAEGTSGQKIIAVEKLKRIFNTL